MTFSSTSFAKKYKPNEILFVELMFGKDSALNKEKNFDERLATAIEMSGVTTDILSREDMKELIHYFISYYQYNNKYQLLVVSQLNFWYVTRKLMDEFSEEEDISKRDKMTDYAAKLEAKVEALFSEIYGDKSITAIAKDQVKVALSPEQRLKRKVKSLPLSTNSDVSKDG